MKNIKKIAGLLLVMIMVLAMMPAAFAEGSGTTAPGIEINGAFEGTEYKLCKIFDLLTYEVGEGNNADKYSYKVVDAWIPFFTTGGGSSYITLDAKHEYFSTWIGGDEEKDYAAFAKAALTYAQENDIDPVASSKDVDNFITDGVGKFTGLELGYYLVDSDMGALCGLTTTNPIGYINAKNKAPTIDKTVKEDSTGAYIDGNTADIGQVVEFMVTISVHSGAQNFVLHDEMTEGLTFDPASVRVEHIIPNVSTNDAVVGTHYTVETDVEHKDEQGNVISTCDFEVVFTEAFCEHINSNDKVNVYYSALLNRNAYVGDEDEDEFNTNETWLEFGENHSTTHDKTVTTTYAFDLVKVDGDGKVLDGASFRIYGSAEGDDEVAVVPLKGVAKAGGDWVEDASSAWTIVLPDETVVKIRPANEGETGTYSVTEYRRARVDENGVEIFVDGGMVCLKGFDNGTYYLEEIKFPTGYNPLTSRHSFTIADENAFATFGADGALSAGSGVAVVNKTGAQLPTTGGIGTTLFYVIGGVLVLAAVVLLVTKKRMNEK